MKKFILLIIFPLLANCQKPIKKETDSMEYLTKIKELYKTVNTYDYEPDYQLWVWSSDCYFEVLVNDMPVMKWFFNSGSIGNRLPITEILKSGEQRITIKMYPPEGQQKLSDRVKLELKIIERTEGMSIDEEKIVYEYKTKQNVDEYDVETFANKDLPYFESQGLFLAKVPYELKGWTESKDLSKIKLKELTKQVIEAYTAYGNAIQNRNLEKMAKTLYNKEKEIAQIWFYKTKEKSENRWNNYQGICNRKGLKIQPLEDYKIQFYGNGRVIALERTDSDYRGESALFVEYVKDGVEKVSFQDFLLHMPKGSNKLEVIR